MISISSITSLEARASQRSRQARGMRYIGGFSLIELMIAIVLGLLVLAGLINLFVANNKAFQLQSGNSFLQENLRIAADRMGWSLRMADFWGGNKASKITVGGGNVVTASGNCNGTWATAVTSGSAGGGAVYGYDGAAAFPFDANCIGGSANYVPGSDVIVLRYAYPQMLSPGPAVANVTPAESATISGNPKQIFLLATSDGTAQLFAGGGAAPAPNGSVFPRYAYPYQVEMYYLRPCSVFAAGATTCTAAADGGTPLPTLMRLHLQLDGTFSSDPVVDGIEQIKFEYGLSTPTADPGNVLPVWSTATQVGTQWANVVAVRTALVAVSPNRDVSVAHASPITLGTLNQCTYIIKANAAADVSKCANFTPYGDKPWQFVRSSQQFISQLRNRVRG